MAFKIEIVDSELRLTVSLSQVICGLCKKSYNRTLQNNPSRDIIFINPLSLFIGIPDLDKWRWIYPEHGDPTFICPTCSLPLRDAEKESEGKKHKVVQSLAEAIVDSNKNGTPT